jgi:cathepsin L
MQQAIYTTPNTVYVEASQPVFQQYTGGVITGTTCGTSTDHAILAVGYNTDASGNNYWIV